MAKLSTALNLILNQHGLQNRKRVGDVIARIALQQPASPEEWKKHYFEKIRTPEEIDAVIDQFSDLVKEYGRLLTDSTRDDCKEFLYNLLFNETYEGWTNRREHLKAQLTRELGIPFEYLYDHPEDWRPEDFKIDFGAAHPESGKWLVIKVLPATERHYSALDSVREQTDEIIRAHREFADRDLGIAMLLYFEQPRKNAPHLKDEDIEKVRAAWDEIGL
jgi:hypothetical protein